MVRVGTCAWADHQDFYPPGTLPGDRLAYYARFFDLVEIDSTYYAPPDLKRVRLWAKAVPQGFMFNMKAHKGVTGHLRQGMAPDEAALAVRRQREALAILKGEGKLGAFLLQFPPWVRADAQGKGVVEQALDLFPDTLSAVEFRHRSWFAGKATEETLRFLEGRRAVHVIADEPQGFEASVPLLPVVTSPRLAIVRLHGRNRATWLKPGLTSSQDRFDYLYDHEELAEIAELAATLTPKTAEVHLLTNNNRANYAVKNALELRSLVLDASLPPATLF